MWVREVGRISPGFYMIGTISNPLYLLKSEDEWILIEGGIKVHFSLVLKQIKEIISDLSLLKHWIITHSHYDHCGLLESMFPCFPGIQIYGSSNTIKNFKNEKYVNKIRLLNQTLEGRLSRSKDETTPGIGMNYFNFTCIDNLSFIGSKQDIKVITTPGHSDCSISLYSISLKTVFVSDAFGEIVNAKKWFPLAFYSMVLFLDSIKKFKELEVNMVALGHHGLLHGHDAQYAPGYAYESCFELINNVGKITSSRGIQFAVDFIDNEYGTNDKSFIPPDLYNKSLLQIVNILEKEKYINTFLNKN